MSTKSEKFVNGLKLSALFASSVLVSACSPPAEPLRVDTTEIQGVQLGLKEYRVLMVRNGCEVGHGVAIDTQNRTTYSLPVTAICPPAGSEVAEDMLGQNVEYQVLYKKYGCEVGQLKAVGVYNLVLCPASGESTVKYTEHHGKKTREVVIEQRRPEQPKASPISP